MTNFARAALAASMIVSLISLAGCAPLPSAEDEVSQYSDSMGQDNQSLKAANEKAARECSPVLRIARVVCACGTENLLQAVVDQICPYRVQGKKLVWLPPDGDTAEDCEQWGERCLDMENSSADAIQKQCAIMQPCDPSKLRGLSTDEQGGQIESCFDSLATDDSFPPDFVISANCANAVTTMKDAQQVKMEDEDDTIGALNALLNTNMTPEIPATRGILAPEDALGPLPLWALGPGNTVFEHAENAPIMTPEEGAAFVNRMGNTRVISPPHGAATSSEGQ